MYVIPAIDIRKGRAVRLVQGDLRDETVYSQEPVSVAKLWKLKGAKRLHVIDLDGAFFRQTLQSRLRQRNYQGDRFQSANGRRYPRHQDN